MAEFPALPLWTDAYLADTSHLTWEEHGLYLTLLMHLWRAPGCRLPDDPQWLMRKFSLNSDTYTKLLKPLIDELCQRNAGDMPGITQKRLMTEWLYLKDRRQKQSQRAKLRWDKEKDICQGNAASGNALSTPTPTPLKERKKEDYAFLGSVIKLNRADHQRWHKNFPGLNGSMDGLLESRDAWLATQPAYDQKKWFTSTAAYPSKKNIEMLAKNPPRKRNIVAGSPEWDAQQAEINAPIKPRENGAAK